MAGSEMLTIRAVRHDEPIKGKCLFCYALIPSRQVQATAYVAVDDEAGIVCDGCIGGDDEMRRRRMRERATWLRDLASELDAWAAGPVDVVALDVLELERLWHEDPVAAAVDGEAERA